jgi:hypothetical protein
MMVDDDVGERMVAALGEPAGELLEGSSARTRTLPL